MKPVWVIDDDHSIRWVLEKALEGAGIPVQSFASGEGIIDRLYREKPAAIISDVRMPGLNGLELLRRIQKQWPQIPVIITTAHSDLDSAVAAFQGGAFEYLPKPFDVDEAVHLTRRALEQNQDAVDDIREADASPEIIGEAPAMQEVFRAIGRLSRSHISVLITGESGTGKELVAHALHRHSPRAEAPFIAMNTAAIPSELLESELFGHERGAFTGAVSQRHGRFEQANGGTLFLDEIGDMPAGLQTRLLRVLADGEFYRVGGHNPIRVNVRVIAATHQDLERLVAEGRFREDLLHRLNVIRIHLPPLRERREDIPQLARHFLNRSALELGVERKRLSPEAERLFMQFPWSGNVRQLENACRWLTVMAPTQVVQPHDLPQEMQKSPLPRAAGAGGEQSVEWDQMLALWARQRLVQGQEDILTEALHRLEKTLLNLALAYTDGHKQEAARKLGWGRNTLTRKLKELGMEHDEEGDEA